MKLRPLCFSAGLACVFFFSFGPSRATDRVHSGLGNFPPSTRKQVFSMKRQKTTDRTRGRHTCREHHHDRLDATFRRNIAIRSAGGDTAGTCCGRVHRVKEGYDGRTRSGQQSTAMPKRDTGHGCLKPVVIVGHHSAVCETGGALHEDLKGLT